MEILETDRLILRGWKECDLYDFYEYAKEPGVGPAAGWKPHENIEESQRILNDFIKKQQVWAIVLKENDKVIGSIGLHDDEKRRLDNAKMMGYVLSKDYWGQGLMTEAAKRVVKYVFEDMKSDVLSIYHYPFNKASKRVIEKCNFKFDGILRCATKRFDGIIFDDYCYSILKNEYFKKDNSI
ncbi:GNAT family N-acetyltransferase [Inconstantimicrobium porci]|uniref:GNAT family N-acetyltransferase n=1 Tax=Inconstantimicrobium porci TaxID=2652291 RepID=A0A7X2MVS6_9CLOT|nr:GNAT family protein [Inconstantimicrobium porci]MSR89974.1 GNAT family N-acetyltransferase [Inconstantimicrobium porci]